MHYAKRPYRMTARQREYVIGVWEGLSNREIGVRLGVTEPTVKKTLQLLAIYSGDDGRHNRSKLVRWAIEEGHLDIWTLRLAKAKEKLKGDDHAKTTEDGRRAVRSQSS